ncbi:bromodomain-containing protein 9 isoform X3 [Scyliorhinus canicula]|uniref:bromodomain-containing protein 9 isoform X3 n=1 Tax=Scyliorhinus canicula TaxID=7830 RepID=UPI0018F5CFFC|nr:bromodomain-containing protein 9 isoform X3 [Scyliorhinus canicula]
MGKKHKKHKCEWRSYDGNDASSFVVKKGKPKREGGFSDKPPEKPLKLVLKVGGSEVTELSGSGHDSSYYDDRSDHERERHKDKKKKKKKKSEKDKHISDEERRRRKEEKKRKREKEHLDSEADADEFDPGKRIEVEPPTDRPVRSCRTKEQVESENTPLQQLLEHFLRQLQRKDPHGFFAFPVTDSIAPGYSMIIKHPMDFSTMKDKIMANEYNSITEFKGDFKLMCDNAMTYNRPETVYYKAAKKLLHTGFKMMSKERLLALKRSMTFMQEIDFSQQAALLGDEDITQEETVAEVTVVPVETTTKKSKKQIKEVISYLYEPEGNACSSTDSTAEEHVLALVEHAADEARDRISRNAANSKIGYLRKEGEGPLLFAVVNQSDPETEEEEVHQVDLSSLTTKLQPGINTMGFKDDRRNKALSVTYLNCVYTAQSIENNTIFPNLTPEETELLYSTYGEETGVQCALSLQEFVKDCGNSTKKMVDDLLNQITAGEHSKAVYHLSQKRNIDQKASKDINMSLDEVQAPAIFIKEEPKLQAACPEASKPIMAGGANGSAGDNRSGLDFMPVKSYSDVSLDISLLNSLGNVVKKEPDHDDNQRNLDETTKLLQDLHEAQTERVGSRPSSNLSSISSNSDREQHHLGSPPHLSVGEQGNLVQDFREFLQSPSSTAAGSLNRNSENT